MFGLGIYAIVSCIFQIAFVCADYECLCNYNVEVPVFPKANSAGEVIGYMYEFDCKAIYAKAAKDSKFQPVQFENQVGYIENGNGLQVQLCQGNVPAEDLVTTTTASTESSTTKASTTTTAATTTMNQPEQTNRTAPVPVSTDRLTSPIKDTTTQVSTTPVQNTSSQPYGAVIVVANGNFTVLTQQSTDNKTLDNNSTTLSLFSLNFTSSTTIFSTIPASTSSNMPIVASQSTSTSTTISIKQLIANSTSTPSPKASTTTTTPPSTRVTTMMPTSSTPPPPATTPLTTTTVHSTTTPTTASPTTTITTTTKIATTTAQKPSCLNGWIMHQTSCYLFQTNSRVHWDDANKDCVSKSSHLAIIETADEYNFLKEQLNHRIDIHNGDDSETSAWVAGRDDRNEGHWEWYDGFTDTYKPLTYTHWGQDEPDAGDGEHEEDCMTMVGEKGFIWADYSCNENMYLVCEQSALPHMNVQTQSPPQQTQSPPKQTNTATCPSGWTMYKGSCYMFHTNSRRHWGDANNDCVSQTSHLAIIETADEFSFLKQQLDQRIDTHDHDHSDTSAWVSGRDNNNEGTWEWYDGLTNTYKPFTFTHWGQDEPDAGDGEHEEDCMTMVGNEGFTWADYSCNENMFYVCEKSALSQTVLQTQSPPKQTNAGSCSPGWINHHGSCYLFNTDSRQRWRDANSLCSAQRAHLVFIETAEEDNFLKQQSSQMIHEHGDSDSGVWVGGSDDDNEGHWEWVDGFSHTSKPMQGYTDWYPGEPDSGDGEHGEDCMCLIGQKGYQWQDYHCTKHMFFICEKSTTFAATLVG